MADVHDKDTRRRNMQAVHSKNTKPEIIVRKLLHALGFRFRLHVKTLPGTPDIVLPKYKAVIFVHGCFWHGHSCKRGALPKSNIEFWQNKIKGNMLRDVSHIARLKDQGWRVLIVWECALIGHGHLEGPQVQEMLSEWLHHGVSNQQLTKSGITSL